MTPLCPLCGADGGVCFDRRDRAPILLNRTYATCAEARAAPTGKLAFTGCVRCGFVWNAAFDEKVVVYDGHYENDQAHSATFRTHIDDMAARVVKLAPPGDQLHIVEVGAGQGVFLEIASDKAGARLESAVGFDPAYRGTPGGGPAPVRLYTDMFDKNTAYRLKRLPNVVVSRHTIEHLPRPLEFLGAIYGALPGLRVKLAVETPCVQWIFDNWAIQDFFYEHCSLFTGRSLALALSAAGFEPRSVTHVFGGQYLWAEAEQKKTKTADWTNADVPNFAGWSKRKDELLSEWRSFVEDASRKGPTYVWGAGAKGITFACLLDPEAALLSGLVDINPMKQNTFAAMTGSPIVAPEAVAGPRPTIIVMNPNYKDEIAKTCAARGLDAQLRVFGA